MAISPALKRPDRQDLEAKTSIEASCSYLKSILNGSSEPFSKLQFSNLFKEESSRWCCLGSVEFEGVSMPIEVRQHSFTIGGKSVNSSYKITSDRLANSLRYRAKVRQADHLHGLFLNSLNCTPADLSTVKARVDAGDYEVVKADGTRMTLQGAAILLGSVDCETLGTIEFMQITSPAAWFGGATVRVHSPASRVFWGELAPENYGYGKGGISTYRAFPHGSVVAVLSASISTPYDAAVGKILVLGKYSEAQTRLEALKAEAAKLWEEV